MMKKIMVLAGMAAMLLCGCGKETVKSEYEATVERAIETSENLVDELATEIANGYIEAIYETFGEDLDESKLRSDDWGVYYGDKYYASWVHLEEVAFKSMWN